MFLGGAPSWIWQTIISRYQTSIVEEYSHQLANLLPEAAADIQKLVTSLDTLENLRIAWQQRDLHLKKRKASKADVGILQRCQRWHCLSRLAVYSQWRRRDPSLATVSMESSGVNSRAEVPIR